MMLKKQFLLAFCTLLFVGFSACDTADDDDGEPDVGPNSFDVEVTGDVEASLDGVASFGSGQDPETGDEAFIIVLSSSEDVGAAESWAVIGRQSERPSTGTYSFTDLSADGDEYPANAFGMFFMMVGEQVIVASNSGQLTLTDSDADQVAGTFEVDATGYNIVQPEQEVDIDLEGEFNATRSTDLEFPTF